MAESGSESTEVESTLRELPSQYFDCFPRVMELFAEEAGIDLDKYVARTPDGVLSDGIEAQEARKSTFDVRVKQFEIFFNALLSPGPESTEPAEAQWLPQYMIKTRPEGHGEVDLEELVKLLKPLLFAFANVLDLNEMVKITVRFGRYSLARAEYLLDHPDELRGAFLEINDDLMLDNTVDNQEPHSEADSSTN